jgi:hypothetical protein
MYTTISTTGGMGFFCADGEARDNSKPKVMPGSWSFVVYFGYDVTGEQDHYAHLIS